MAVKGLIYHVLKKRLGSPIERETYDRWEITPECSIYVNHHNKDGDRCQIVARVAHKFPYGTRLKKYLETTYPGHYSMFGEYRIGIDKINDVLDILQGKNGVTRIKKRKPKMETKKMETVHEVLIKRLGSPIVRNKEFLRWEVADKCSIHYNQTHSEGRFCEISYKGARRFPNGGRLVTYLNKHYHCARKINGYRIRITHIHKVLDIILENSNAVPTNKWEHAINSPEAIIDILIWRGGYSLEEIGDLANVTIAKVNAHIDHLTFYHEMAVSLNAYDEVFLTICDAADLED